MVRQWTLTPPFRGFKSFRPNHRSNKIALALRGLFCSTQWRLRAAKRHANAIASIVFARISRSQKCPCYARAFLTTAMAFVFAASRLDKRSLLAIRFCFAKHAKTTRDCGSGLFCSYRSTLLASRNHEKRSGLCFKIGLFLPGNSRFL